MSAADLGYGSAGRHWRSSRFGATGCRLSAVFTGQRRRFWREGRLSACIERITRPRLTKIPCAWNSAWIPAAAACLPGALARLTNERRQAIVLEPPLRRRSSAPGVESGRDTWSIRQCFVIGWRAISASMNADFTWAASRTRSREGRTARPCPVCEWARRLPETTGQGASPISAPCPRLDHRSTGAVASRPVLATCPSAVHARTGAVRCGRLSIRTRDHVGPPEVLRPPRNSDGRTGRPHDRPVGKAAPVAVNPGIRWKRRPSSPPGLGSRSAESRNVNRGRLRDNPTRTAYTVSQAVQFVRGPTGDVPRHAAVEHRVEAIGALERAHNREWLPAPASAGHVATVSRDSDAGPVARAHLEKRRAGGSNVAPGRPVYARQEGGPAGACGHGEAAHGILLLLDAKGPLRAACAVGLSWWLPLRRVAHSSGPIEGYRYGHPAVGRKWGYPGVTRSACPNQGTGAVRLACLGHGAPLNRSPVFGPPATVDTEAAGHGRPRRPIPCRAPRLHPHKPQDGQVHHRGPVSLRSYTCSKWRKLQRAALVSFPILVGAAGFEAARDRPSILRIARTDIDWYRPGTLARRM